MDDDFLITQETKKNKQTVAGPDSNPVPPVRNAACISVWLFFNMLHMFSFTETDMSDSHGRYYVHWLTGDVIVPPLEELQTPQVRAELLKLECEFDVPVGLVTVQERCVRLVKGAALHLTSGDQVHSVELLLFPQRRICPGTYNVHLVSYLRIQDQTLTGSKSVGKRETG